jgi:hypothetical protein
MKTTTGTLSFQQELEKLVASAPSRAGLLAATVKLETLRLQRNDASTALIALEKEFATEAQKTAERAKELIQNGKVPTFTTSDELRQARLSMNVILAAISAQEREVQSLSAHLSREVRLSLRPFRQRLVARVGAALQELENVAREDAEAVSVVGRQGADSNMVGYLPIPQSFVAGGAKTWLSARRAEGYEA